MSHPAPIGSSPEFPVRWEHPEDEKMFWTHDRMHWPDPLPIVILDLQPEDGVNSAALEYDLPLRFSARRINTYQYSCFHPPALPPDQLQTMGERAREKIGATIGRLGERWETEWLPTIKQHLAFWDAFDLANADTPALIAHVDETFVRLKDLWHIHFLIAFPMLMSVSLFDELYRELFGSEGAFDAYKLLQGFDNKTVESGRELWKLSRRALALPAVRTVLEERAAEEVIEALGESAEGRAFLVELDRYLETYGTRGDKFATLVEVSWIENPTSVIKNLKDLVGQPQRDLEAEHAARVAERETALATARQRLAGYPRPVVEQFEGLLRAAQVGTVLSEDHGYWIDYSGTYRGRRVLLEIGRRCADAGVLDRADDVVHLTLAEIKETLATLPRIDRRGLVQQRKAQIERFRAIVPPPALGTPPSGPPPDDAAGRTMAKFFGSPPRPSTEPGVLTGTAGSPGRYRGPARVIRSLADSAKLQTGDVLVTETTAPPWTPMFATAGAVVTDTGGVLSHCAVVAREYRIPAVVGTAVATTAIRDGQILEVDGDAGTVRLIAS